MPTGDESAGVVVCDVEAGGASDLATVELLARLELCARGFGWRIRLRRVSGELAELIALVGLDDVLGLDVVGEAEEGEEAGRVEE